MSYALEADDYGAQWADDHGTWRRSDGASLHRLAGTTWGLMTNVGEMTLQAPNYRAAMNMADELWPAS